MPKPHWQPPARSSGAAWTRSARASYGPGGRALPAPRTQERGVALTASHCANLAVKTAWNWAFFRMRSTKAGLVGTALLGVSDAEFIARAVKAAEGLLPHWSRRRLGAGSPPS
ncbi:tryptophan-rich sensory protein [Streptomyces sp. NBC_00385]|uniref:tryptophan-rich sensory protein n=1 Tax=Streptomyces sp. NBC_00385 TaxID=2975733 RepID=UPI002DDA1AB1|nr:tryptophan-rich sensory protein [Streptomyces sp. NBC_00385]WRZ08797.1 tryptophan-rich sensory protein [Streptomyces sp. NBC_00385]